MGYLIATLIPTLLIFVFTNIAKNWLKHPYTAGSDAMIVMATVVFTTGCLPGEVAEYVSAIPKTLIPGIFICVGFSILVIWAILPIPVETRLIKAKYARTPTEKEKYKLRFFKDWGRLVLSWLLVVFLIALFIYMFLFKFQEVAI